MNKYIISLISVLMALSAAAGKTSVINFPEGAFSDMEVKKTENSLLISMKINPSAFPKKATREYKISPMLVSSSTSVSLPEVMITGRTRYYQNLRMHDLPEGVVQLRAGDKAPYSYLAVVPFSDELEKSELVINGYVNGCCGNNLGAVNPLNAYNIDYREKTITPLLVYISPVKEVVKTREEKGEAYIDFPIGKTEIYPEYRNNPTELAKIRNTIENIHKDSDITITLLSFKGYASPDGSYALNELLAKGRTEALINYVSRLYSFPKSIMKADWVAEDWKGLADYIRKMNISDKGALLEIVTDNSLAPDAREEKLRRNFPRLYNVLLNEVYPKLRHSDYVVSYKVREFTDIAEIAAVMKTNPSKLSQDELFMYARSLDVNSPEFKEVMEVAVRLYPKDPTANLNAAMTAIGRNELDRAAGYLEKADPEAPATTYAYGIIYTMTKDFQKAIPLLDKAAAAGVEEAADLLEQIQNFSSSY